MNRCSLTARKLQSQAILSEWVRYAREIFNEKPAVPSKPAFEDDQAGHESFSVKRHFLPHKEREENARLLTFQDCGTSDATAARETLSLSFGNASMENHSDQEHGECARRAPARTSKRGRQANSGGQARFL